MGYFGWVFGFVFSIIQISVQWIPVFKKLHLIRAAVKVEVGICRVCPLAAVLNGQKTMGAPPKLHPPPSHELIPPYCVNNQAL